VSSGQLPVDRAPKFTGQLFKIPKVAFLMLTDVPQVSRRKILADKDLGLEG
jgi:hypothetical protein